MNLFDLMIKITTDTTEVSKGVSDAKSKVSKLGGSLKTGLTVAAKAGVAAIGAATTAVGAFAVSAINAGKDFDNSMSQVAATMGKSVDEIDDLRNFAQEMGRTTAFSATQAADALNYMALAGYDSAMSMQMLPNVLNLAAAGNMDLARASDMVTDTQTAFGISAERTTQMVDEMAKAASTGNTNVEQLGDAFLTVGGLAKELNGGMVTLADGTTKEVDGVQELEIALTAMANAGIKGSEAGTHMRNMLLKLSSPTDDGVAQMEALGVSVFDAEGKMRSLHDIMGDLSGALGELTQEQKIQAISDLFNARDIASAEALLGAVEQDWDKIGESILNAEGAADKMAKTQLDNLAGDITLFKSALEGAQIAISDGMTPTLRSFVKLGTNSISELTYAFQTKGIDGVMKVVPRLLSRAIKLVLETVPKLVDVGVQLLSALGQGLLDNMDLIIDAATQILLQITNALVTGIPALLEGAFQIILGIANGIIEALPELIPAVIEMVNQIVNTIGENLPLLLNAAIEIIMAIANGLIAMLPTLIPSVVSIIMNIVNILIANVSQLINAAVEIIMAIANGLIEALPELIPAVVDIILKIAEALVDNLDELLTATVEIMIAIGAGLIKAIPEIITRLPEIYKKMYSSFLEMDWASIGVNLIEGIGKGILDAGRSLVEKAKSVVRQAFGAQKKVLEEHSPSKRAEREIGVNWSAGIGIGFVKRMKTVSKDMVDSVDDAFEEMEEAMPENGGVSDSMGYDIIDTGDGVGVGGAFAPVINVYGAEGQDVNELADIVMDRMAVMFRRKKVSYA